MNRDLERELGIGRQWQKILFKYGFVKVEEKYHSKPFGDAWVRFESPELGLAFVQDKGVHSVLVGPRTTRYPGLSELDDLMFVLGALGDVASGDQPSLEQLAPKFSDNYSKISSVFSANPPPG